MADPKPEPSKRAFKPTPKTWIVGGIALLIVVIVASSSGVGGVISLIGLVGLGTAIFALVTGRKSWARIPTRKVGVITLAVALVVTAVGGAMAGTPKTPSTQTAQVAPAGNHTKAPKAPNIPKTTVAFTEGDPGDPTIVTAADGQPVVVITDNTVTDASATALLETLPVKGKAPKTGYDRTGMFGTAWLDVDHNGCDTRNDILARDLTAAIKSGSCKVLSGTLAEPYTGKTIAFVRGQETSALVQIDHIVALSNAWQTGAQQLTQAQRISLANDPINLLAVDGPINAQKGDGDAATWLPPVKSFRCTYVARQISVKATYGLWVTQAEHDAMARILSSCPDQRAVTSVFAPVVETPPAPAPVAPPAPQPAPPAPKPAPVAPAPKPAPPAPAGTVHAGSFCSSAGATGVTSTGKPMVCKTSATDSRLRWRAA